MQEALVRWLVEGWNSKEVVNLAFHEFFERRRYLLRRTCFDLAHKRCTPVGFRWCLRWHTHRFRSHQGQTVIVNFLQSNHVLIMYYDV